MFNLFLVLVILKKLTNKFGYIAGGFLYILVNYFVVENVLWYELIITLNYLLIYLLLISKKIKLQNILLGLLIASASFIKPIAAVILLPVIYKTRSIKTIITFVICWLLVLSYFYFNQGINQFMTDLFLFNNYLAGHLHNNYFSDFKFLASSVILGLFSIFLTFKNKLYKRFSPLILIIITSIVFLFLGYWRVHLVPVITFFTLLVAVTLGYKNSTLKTIFIIFVFIYTGLLTRKVILHYEYLNNKRVPYVEDKMSKEIISKLTNLKTKNFYLLSNHAEIYVALDQLPPTYFPLKFPISEEFIPNYEQNMISELQQRHVDYVIVPKPIDADYLNLEILQKYIFANYNPILETGQFKLLQLAPK